MKKNIEKHLHMSYGNSIFVPETRNFLGRNIPVMMKKMDRKIYVIVNLDNFAISVARSKREVIYLTNIGKNRLNNLSGRGVYGHYLISEHTI